MKRNLNAREEELEIIKCGTDPAYFIRNYIEIQHPTKGRLMFELYPFQETVLEHVEKYRFNIVLKSRQLGLSTVMSAYCLWLAVFGRDKNILLVADKFQGSKNMLAKIRIAYRSLPKWMLNRLDLQELEGESVQHLKFSNGSKIQALPTTLHTARGEAASFVVVDEAAINDKLDEAWKSIYSTVTTGGNIIVFSTPLGKKGKFYELWSENSITVDEYNEIPKLTDPKVINRRKNAFIQLELPWNVHPEHDQEWFDAETVNMSEQQIAQELLCSFESSGRGFFANSTQEWLHATSRLPMEYASTHVKGGNHQEIWVWAKPKPNHEYLLCADVARGDADDYSAFYILDKNDSEIVVEYVGKILPDKYADVLTRWGYQYNTAQIIQEKNTIGVATSIRLRDLAYPNLYYDNLTPEELECLTPEQKENLLPGFTTKTGTKPGNRDEILNLLENALRNHRIKIYSSRLAQQAMTFNVFGKSGRAPKGKNDDLVMALGLINYFGKPNATGDDFNSYNSQQETTEWAMVFLKSTSRGSRGQPNVVNGKQLPPGVRKEDVENYLAYTNPFAWVMQ